MYRSTHGSDYDTNKSKMKGLPNPNRQTKARPISKFLQSEVLVILLSVSRDIVAFEGKWNRGFGTIQEHVHSLKLAAKVPEKRP